MSFPIEVNGAANIIAICDSKVFGESEIHEIRRQAWLLSEYMKQLEGRSPMPWHEFIKL